MTPYEILDVTPQDGPLTIRAAYRTLCMRHHPDRPHNADNPDAHAAFLRIQRAYDLLSDPIQKAAYDANPYDLDADPADQSLMTQKDAALENEARDLLANIFNRHVDKLSLHSAKKFDMQKTIRAELNDGICKMKSHQRQTLPIAKKLNVIRHRLSPTPYLHEVLRKKRQANVNTWASARWQIMIARRALSILYETNYQADPELASPYAYSDSITISDSATRPIPDFLHQRRTNT